MTPGTAHDTPPETETHTVGPDDDGVLVGSTIGPYRIVSRLGAGGMGEVYLARDGRLGRDVAIKVLRPKLAERDGFRDQLLREARAVARLSHVNIAPVYDVIDEGGRAHIVMERLEGEPLSVRLARGPLPLAEVLALGQQIAAALAHAHAHGILHCDLKPANVFVTEQGVAKVLDFGLARCVDAGSDTGADEVGASVSLVLGGAGTPEYMSPEHRAGRGVDQRSDVYGLGIVLHEMATGRRPARLPIAYSDGETTRVTSAPMQLDRALPRPLRPVVARALAPDRADRYGSVAELGEALAAISTRGDGRRRAWIVAAIAAVIVIAGVARWRDSATAMPFKERDWALVSGFEDTGGDGSLGRTVREGFIIALQQSRFLNVVGGPRIADALARMQRPPGSPVDERTGLEICRREGVPLLIAGATTRAGATSQITVRGFDSATGRVLFVESRTYRRPDDVFAAVDDLARRVRRQLGESLARIAESSAPLEKVTTRSFEALQQYSAAVEARARAHPEEALAPLQTAITIDPDFAMAHMKLGDYYQLVGGDNAKALEHLARAYALSERVTERERHLIAAAYFSALQQYERARESVQAVATLYPDDPDIRYELGAANSSLNDLDRAIDELREAVRLDPRGTRAYGTLLLLLATDSRPSEALAVQQQAIALGIDSPYLRWGSGLARLALGDVGAARREFEALRGAGGFYGRVGQLHIARLSLYEGRLEDAAALLQAAARTSREAGDAGLEMVERALLGRTYLVAGDVGRARREALAILQAPPASVMAEDLRRAGGLLADGGDVRNARVAEARLAALQQTSGGRYTEFCRQHVAGRIALAEGHPERAAEAFEAAGAKWRWYETWQGLAETWERRGDWSRAVAERQRALSTPARILRDGFPLDWARGHVALARAYAEAGDCDNARRTADEARRLLPAQPPRGRWLVADAAVLARATACGQTGR